MDPGRPADSADVSLGRLAAENAAGRALARRLDGLAARSLCADAFELELDVRRLIADVEHRLFPFTMSEDEVLAPLALEQVSDSDLRRRMDEAERARRALSARLARLGVSFTVSLDITARRQLRRLLDDLRRHVELRLELDDKVFRPVLELAGRVDELQPAAEQFERSIAWHRSGAV